MTMSLSSLLTAPIDVGEPDVSGPLAVFPLFGPQPRLAYRSFAQACQAGAVVRELPGGASVRDVLVENGSDQPLLLYEGEEVIGAQQNRTFDVAVLVLAGAKLQVPVSCVEAGRWDGSRHAERFAPAPQTAYPELRRAKHVQAAAAAAVGREARADQGAVWEEVASKSYRHSVASATSAMSDIYDSRGDRLAEMQDAMRLRERQCGALVAIGGRFQVVDWVSRPDVYASLHGPLVRGYALDALEAADSPVPDAADARGLMELALGAPTRREPAVGAGERVRFAEGEVVGSALSAEDELVQLTAFAGASTAPPPPGAASARAARVRRPSRRRPPQA